VKTSKVFVLLLTKSVLTRPWCLVEIYTALSSNIPIVPVLLKVPNNPKDEYSFSAAALMLADLEDFVSDEERMQAHWGEPRWSASRWEADAIATVRTATAQQVREMSSREMSSTVATPTGGALTLAEIQALLSAELGGKKAEQYNPQAAERVRRAQISVITKRVRGAMLHAGDADAAGSRVAFEGGVAVERAALEKLLRALEPEAAAALRELHETNTALHPPCDSGPQALFLGAEKLLSNAANPDGSYFLGPNNFRGGSDSRAQALKLQNVTMRERLVTGGGVIIMGREQ
jgi:hypothetical protein